MNNKYVFAVVGAVVGLVIGFYAFGAKVSSSEVTFGSITASTKTLDSQDLTNELSLIVAPLQAIEQSTTASITFPAVNPAVPQSTTTNIGVAASLGDVVEIAPNGTSTGAPVYSAQVTTASTTSATVTIEAQGGTAGTSTPNAQTFNVTVLPFASFKAPVGL